MEEQVTFDVKKIEALANVIQELMIQVDTFTQVLSSNDFDLLEAAKKSLEDKINYKMSAAPLILALGGNSDTTDDHYKLKSLYALIDFMKLRIEYREEIIKRKKEEKARKDNLKELQALGLF